MSLNVKMQDYRLIDDSVTPLVKRVGDGSIVNRFDKTPTPTKNTDVVCPHFLELKWAYGCPYDCAWCYLKGTFRFLPTKTKPVIKDLAKVELHTKRLLEQKEPEILNTGEIADSLMLERNGNSFSKLIIPLFENQERHKILFVTKSDNIRNLLSAPTHNQVIISFSLNAEDVAKKWELGAPSVERRIKAASSLSKAGYETRIRIDPMVPISDWQKAYSNLLNQIFSEFMPSRITFGSLRGLQSTINNSTDRSWVQFLTEKSNWGKKVDFDLRYEMYSTIIKQLESNFGYKNIALCKETVEMWDKLDMDYKQIKCNCIW